MNSQKKINNIKDNMVNLRSQVGLYKDYTKSEIYTLWKASGLSIDKVAEMLHRSPEQAKKYCYGYIESRQMRIKIGDFFKNAINTHKQTRKDMEKN